VQELCNNADIGDASDSFSRGPRRRFRVLIADVIENLVRCRRDVPRIRLTVPLAPSSECEMIVPVARQTLMAVVTKALAAFGLDGYPIAPGQQIKLDYL
jgi:hypothetical protein